MLPCHFSRSNRCLPAIEKVGEGATISKRRQSHAQNFILTVRSHYSAGNKPCCGELESKYDPVNYQVC